MNHIQLVARVLVIVSLLTACSGGSKEEAPREKQPATDATDASDIPGVIADLAMQRSLGVEMAEVSAASIQAQSQGTATVIDSATFAASVADLDSLRAEAATAYASQKRVAGLFEDGGNASRQAVDSARQQSSSLRGKLAGAESRARLDWGDKLARRDDPASARLRTDVASGAMTLFRAEFPGALADAAKLKYGLVSSHHDSQALEYIDRSRAPAQFSAGESVLLGSRSAGSANAAFRPGERVSVVATASGVARPIVPADAAIAYAGRLWCYVARPDDRFERIALDGDVAGPAGYAAPESIRSGDRVVVSGAALLLSLEKSASAEVGAGGEE